MGAEAPEEAPLKRKPGRPKGSYGRTKRAMKANIRARGGNAATMAIKYRPKPKQKLFGDMLASGKRVVLFLGGIRSGKTYAGAYEALKQIYLYCKKPSLGWIVSPTYPMSEVTARMFEEAAGGLIVKKYRAQRAYLMHPNKASDEPFRVELKTAENPDYLRGVGLSFIWIDEAAMISQEAWKILLGRVLDTKGVIFLTTTPAGMNWLHKEVYEESLTNPLYGVVKASTLENTSLDPADIASLRTKYSKDFARQELDAEFVNFEGLVYKGFDSRFHITKTFMDLPSGGELIGGIDEGYRDPFVHLWVLKQGGKFYVVDEYYEPMRTIQSHATSIRAARFDQSVIRRWADPSGAQERSDLSLLGVDSYPARNDIKAGINAVENLLETGRLFIAQNCLNTLKEIGEYHYPTKNGRNSGEDPVDCSNHCMDALRYVIYSEINHAQAHPMVVVEDNGEMKVFGGSGDPFSNRLEDWIKLKPAVGVGHITEDELLEGARGVGIEEDW